MKLIFFSLASGSSGNCYYLGTPEYGLLIDAGIGIRTIKKVLKDRSIDLSQIVAILVTHDHADHIKTVGYLGEKMSIPVYTTEGVHRGIAKSRYVEETLTTSKRVIEKEVPFFIRESIVVQQFQLTAQVCHKVSVIVDRKIGIALLLQHPDKCLLQRGLALVGIRTLALRFVFCYNGTFVAGSNYIVSAHAPNSLNVKSLSR